MRFSRNGKIQKEVKLFLIVKNVYRLRLSNDINLNVYFMLQSLEKGSLELKRRENLSYMLEKKTSSLISSEEKERQTDRPRINGNEKERDEI